MMKQLTRKTISVLLSLLMILSVCAGLALLANAAEDEGGDEATVTYTPVRRKSETCTEPGNLEYYQGSDGKIYKLVLSQGEDNEVISTFIETTEEEVVIPAGHKLKKVEAKEPDCTDGYNEHWICSRCGAVFSNAEGTETFASPNEDFIIPALGHDYTVSVVAPTCYREGKRIYTCNRCGYTYEETDDTLKQLTHADYDGNGECDFCGAYTTPGACRYCGKVHSGTFGKVTEIFHGILWFFRELFN